MDITPAQLDGKPKVIGSTKKGLKLFALKTKGGFHMVVKRDGTSFQVLGGGPHAAVARHMAQQKLQDATFFELSKAEWVDPASFQHLLPKYERVVEQYNRLLGQG